MRIINDLSSKDYNSFGIDVPIPCLIEIQDKADYNYLDIKGPFRILGGGSNILISGSLEEKIIYVNNKGIEILIDHEDHCLVEFAAGELWHDAVMWALDKGLGGIENLSLIPGKCGAAPMQNIGAYGVEIKDVLHSVKSFDLQNKLELTFHNSECGFGYRSSHFKTKWRDSYIITSIILKLSKNGYHTINTEYGAIQAQLEAMNCSDNPSIRDVSEAVIAIRSSKLPDPREIGNAGSFFKNPVIPQSQFETLKDRYPDIVSYPADGGIKLAAGWLIDQCGLKGYTENSGAAVHDRQALVLVRQGNAKGDDILLLAQKVKNSVFEKFGIKLEEEVNIWA